MKFETQFTDSIIQNAIPQPNLISCYPPLKILNAQIIYQQITIGPCKQTQKCIDQQTLTYSIMQLAILLYQARTKNKAQSNFAILYNNINLSQSINHNITTIIFLYYNTLYSNIQYTIYKTIRNNPTIPYFQLLFGEQQMQDKTPNRKDTHGEHRHIVIQESQPKSKSPQHYHNSYNNSIVIMDYSCSSRSHSSRKNQNSNCNPKHKYHHHHQQYEQSQPQQVPQQPQPQQTINSETNTNPQLHIISNTRKYDYLNKYNQHQILAKGEGYENYNSEEIYGRKDAKEDKDHKEDEGKGKDQFGDIVRERVRNRFKQGERREEKDNTDGNLKRKYLGVSLDLKRSYGMNSTITQFKSFQNTKILHSQSNNNSRSKQRSRSHSSSSNSIRQPRFHYLQAYKNSIPGSGQPYRYFSPNRLHVDYNPTFNPNSSQSPVPSASPPLTLLHPCQPQAPIPPLLITPNQSISISHILPPIPPSPANSLSLTLPLLSAQISHQNDLYRGQVNEYRTMITKMENQLRKNREEKDKMNFLWGKERDEYENRIRVLEEIRERYEILDRQNRELVKMLDLEKKRRQSAQNSLQNKQNCMINENQNTKKISYRLFNQQKQSTSKGKIRQNKLKQASKQSRPGPSQLTSNFSLYNILLSKLNIILSTNKNQEKSMNCAVNETNRSKLVEKLDQKAQKMLQKLQNLVRKCKKNQDFIDNVREMYEKIMGIAKVGTESRKQKQIVSIKDLWKWLKRLGSIYSFIQEVKPFLVKKAGLQIEKDDNKFQIQQILERIILLPDLNLEIDSRPKSIIETDLQKQKQNLTKREYKYLNKGLLKKQ